jgi:UrcA family protein
MVRQPHQTGTPAMNTMLLALAAFVNLTAAAADAQTVPTTTVSYADLDLHTGAGMKTLHVRLRNAGRSVCTAGQDGTLATRVASQKCFKTAMADAMKQLPDFAVQEVASR